MNTIVPTKTGEAQNSLALPSAGQKVARQSAKEFKAALPTTFTPKQKRQAYDEYAAQFSMSGAAALSAALASGSHMVKAIRSGKSGNLNAVLVAVKERSPSAAAKLKQENAALAQRIAELEAKLSVAPSTVAEPVLA